MHTYSFQRRQVPAGERIGTDQLSLKLCYIDVLPYFSFPYDKGMPAGERDALLRVALLFAWIINKDSFHDMNKGPCRRAGRSFQEILATVW